MNKRIFFAVLSALLLNLSVLHAGEVKDDVSATAEELGKTLEPVGEDADYLGRSAVYGIGAIVVAPFRFVQDMINAFCQGASNEKLWDHTN